MLFNLKIPLVGGAGDFPDPRVAPALVLRNNVMKLEVARFSDQAVTRILLALEGTATQDVEVELWTPDESADAFANDADSIKDSFPDALEWYEVTTPGAPPTVTVGAVSEVNVRIPTSGLLYLRCTGLPAADAILKAACG